jgi:paraquat-inducible protein B
VSLVWIVPILAILIGASLVVRNWMQQGPVITISSTAARDWWRTRPR